MTTVMVMSRWFAAGVVVARNLLMAGAASGVSFEMSPFHHLSPVHAAETNKTKSKGIETL